jgi:hypothetical protein
VLELVAVVVPEPPVPPVVVVAVVVLVVDPPLPVVVVSLPQLAVAAAASRAATKISGLHRFVIMRKLLRGYDPADAGRRATAARRASVATSRGLPTKEADLQIIF